MGWLENLKNMEPSIENKGEKNIEKDSVGTTKPQIIKTRNDIIDALKSIDSSYDVIEDLKKLGLDINEPSSALIKRIKEIIEIGKKESLLNEDDILNLNKKLQSLIDLVERNDNDYDR